MSWIKCSNKYWIKECRQKKITRAIINAQEKERNHIEQELHDNINQILAGSKLYLSVAGKRNPELKESLVSPIQLIGDANKGNVEIESSPKNELK